ncbi:uncharacterized protein PpBr36_06058 [Pyricularia pennisetigena]|uniref:uncharacterized protein n=1 Tax=Pyricularia pennisetigena TaxID=1578925 RepID=UPI0011537B7F|nr:uncharacterized protein PpBr36_06058 [Pyricularia pennisetigena]TLS23390.1 hypothetical protein PpBr36_06058 [Pyricularia pennisetigena]
MLSRTAGSGLGAAGLCRLAVTKQPLITNQRCFSQTPSRQATVIRFSKTRKPELNQLLTIMRDKILLPYYIPADQRKLLVRTSNKEKLAKNPIVLEVDGEIYKFGYRNPAVDNPSPRDTIMKAIKLMDTDSDFNNLNLLLEGLHSVAKVKWQKPWDMTRIVRRAGYHGQILKILEAARRVEATGVKLDDAEVVSEVMYWIQERAYGLRPQAEHWSQKGTAQALKWADMVVDMLHLPEHKPAVTPQGQPRGLAFMYDPKVRGAQLHLAAALASKHPQPEQPDVDAAQRKRVTELAKGLTHSWPAGKGLREIHPPKIGKKGYLYFMTNDAGFLRVAAPILHGLELAIEIVEPELAEQLQSRRDALAAEVDEVIAKGPEKVVNGLRTYDALFGTQHAPTDLKWEPETKAEAEAEA